jgi:predicted small lipoprotein YifL
MKVRLGTALAAALLALTACGNESPDQDRTAAARSQVEHPQADRYRQFAMSETRRLARRLCKQVPPRTLSRYLGDAGVPGHSTDPNYVALGLARDIRISPIPLQRAAYDGCGHGVRSQLSER